ncbi:hypothetical protein GHT06_016889 [Daphnia sinensis]|uniref:Uncharacterized protein n=1 Tax=Daphnia sinensis TaxID=1820382 RepID=A0AAD5KP42_9CRUS|nr:hypothetical protein GHT06_016889 [Daphnia sinensis]
MVSNIAISHLHAPAGRRPLRELSTGKNGHAPSYVVSPTGRVFVGRVNDHRRRK